MDNVISSVILLFSSFSKITFAFIAVALFVLNLIRYWIIIKRVDYKEYMHLKYLRDNLIELSNNNYNTKVGKKFNKKNKRNLHNVEASVRISRDERTKILNDINKYRMILDRDLKELEAKNKNIRVMNTIYDSIDFIGNPLSESTNRNEKTT